MTSTITQPAPTLASELGYRPRPPNAVQRLAQAVVGSRSGGWVASRVLRPVDHAVERLSRGRLLPSSMVAGLPIVELVTIGARTGRARSAFLLGIPFDDRIAVAGADFASAKEPAWVGNLLAEPMATLAYRSRRISVVARLATDAEFARIADSAAHVYPPSAAYVTRIRARPLRAFVLSKR